MKILILTVILLLISPFKAYAELDTEIRDYPEFNGYVERLSKGENPFTPEGVLNSLTDALFGEISRSKADLGAILTLAAAAGLLRLTDSLGSCHDAAYFCTYALMSATAVKLLGETAGYGSEVVHSICDFITKLSPVFLGLMAASGKITSAAAFSPVLSGAVYVFTLAMDVIITPLVYMSAVFGIIGNISAKVQLTSFNKLLRSFARWVLTALFTVFTSLTALYGFNAPVLDALSAKSAKFAVGTLVPVVGGLLADTVDTVVSGTRVLKNAVGSAGMICVVVIAAFPVVKVWIIWFMLRLSAALAEPLCDKRMTVMLSDVSESVGTVLALMLTAVMLFLITIGIMLGLTGAA
ncbi:MAG: stage III sporulation protein AE [Clostridia bacterium]|nr:stage III sporulation protein AE [Clostridia bacterium]